MVRIRQPFSQVKEWIWELSGNTGLRLSQQIGAFWVRQITAATRDCGTLWASLRSSQSSTGLLSLNLVDDAFWKLTNRGVLPVVVLCLESVCACHTAILARPGLPKPAVVFFLQEQLKACGLP